MKYLTNWANGNKQIIGALDEFPNLFVDSAASTYWVYRNISFEGIARNHTDKILFGSDEPWTKYEKEIAKIKSFDLSENELERIMLKNYYQLWK